MNKIPKISIIVPVYNVQEFLKECVDSLLNQTYHSIEIILVNDGSTDNSPAICDNYLELDERVKVIHKSNGGLVSARNAGFEEISGEWFMFVDSDDLLLKNCCEELVNIINNNFDIIFWNSSQYYDGVISPLFLRWKEQKDVISYDINQCSRLALETLNYTSGIATAYSKLIRTDFARKHALLHDSRLRQGAEGMEFSFRLFYFAECALFINKEMYLYRYNINAISKSVNKKNTYYILDCLNVIQEFIHENNLSNEYLVMLRQRTQYILIALALNVYFSPLNKETLKEKSHEYTSLIKQNKIFQDALYKTSIKHLDKSRYVALLCLRYKLYFFVSLISELKNKRIQNGQVGF